MNRTNIGIVTALDQEVAHEQLHLMGIKHIAVVGVGKVNAAIATMQFLNHFRELELIINIGTAGSVNKTLGEVLRCSNFIQRDFELPFAEFAHFNLTVSFSELLHKAYPQLLNCNKTCSTGDNFVHLDDHHNEQTFKADCIDMEAYAIAKACQKMNTKFLALKYISDNSNSDSKDDWQDSLHGKASTALMHELREVLNQISH